MNLIAIKSLFLMEALNIRDRDKVNAFITEQHPDPAC